MDIVKRALGYLALTAFLAATTAGLWLPPIISHATEKDYWFPDVRIDATLRSNGDLALEERRTFDFRNGPFTYAYFNVDDPLDHVRDFSISELRPDGTEIPVQPAFAYHSIITNGFQAQWDFSANDEERTWVFRYTVACAAAVYDDTAQLYWQFIGTGWDRPTGHALITVHLPDRAEAAPARPADCTPDERPAATVPGTPLTRSDVRAFGHGPLNGSVTFHGASTIRYDVHDVPPASFVEGSILLPTDALPNAPQHPVDKLQEILGQERVWADQANALRSRHETELGLRGAAVVGMERAPLAAERVSSATPPPRAARRDRDPGRGSRHRSDGSRARAQGRRDGAPDGRRSGLPVADLRPG
jgi:hypothetical protein